jgi:putative thioredoxin
MSTPVVFDVSAPSFQAEVIERSLEVPILLDFWAAWCGPCKSFTPLLEKLAAEYHGAFLLGKIDVEAEPELAQAFRVQSVPFVAVIHKGRPVDAFAGALPESELRTLLESLGVQPAEGSADDDEPVEVPADEAALRAARAAAQAGDAAAARDALAGFPDESLRLGDHDNLLAGLAFLEAEIPSGAPAADLLLTARGEFLAGRMEPALVSIVESARVDKSFGAGLARQAMRLCQGMVDESETVDVYRRQLATLLY